MLLQFKTKQDLDEAVEYIKKNVSQLYLEYREENGQKYMFFDLNIDIKKQIVYHKSDMSFNFLNYRKYFNITNNNRLFELHIFNNNKLLILGQHAVCDGRYMLELIKNIENKTPQKLQMVDNIYEIFKNEYEEYKQNLENGLYKIKYSNNYQVIENKYREKYQEIVEIDMNNEPQLQHRFNQKLILIHSLYKLYVLRFQGKLSNINQLLQDGIAINLKYIVDARKYANKQYNFGFCASTIFENYILQGNKTVKEYIEYFIDSLNKMVERKEQFSFLHTLISSSSKSSISEDQQNIITGLTFSNIGQINTEFYKDIQLGMSYSMNHMNNLETILFTYNNHLKIIYSCPKEYQNYNLNKIITILLKNIQEDRTIEQLWNMIKNE